MVDLNVYGSELTIVCSGYPSILRESSGAFVRSVAHELVRQGVSVQVVCPANVKEWWLAVRSGDISSGSGPVTVRRPLRWSFGSTQKLPLVRDSYLWSVKAFERAVVKECLRLPRSRIYYGHFIFPAGYAAVRFAERFDAKAVIAVGESRFAMYDRVFGVDGVRRVLGCADRIVCVNSAQLALLSDRYEIDVERMVVLPNGVDLKLFRPMAQAEARMRLGLEGSHRRVAFVGHFDDNKGVMRVLDALRGMTGVRGIFVGAGAMAPRGAEVEFAGAMRQEELPMWLAASDAFVLPSRSEGSPSALLEAMAMGLPCVVSDRPFMWEMVGQAPGTFFVDPDDVAAIRFAIKSALSIADDPEIRRQLRHRAASFSLEARAGMLRERVLK